MFRYASPSQLDWGSSLHLKTTHIDTELRYRHGNSITTGMELISCCGNDDNMHYLLDCINRDTSNPGYPYFSSKTVKVFRKSLDIVVITP